MQYEPFHTSQLLINLWKREETTFHLGIPFRKENWVTCIRNSSEGKKIEKWFNDTFEPELALTGEREFVYQILFMALFPQNLMLY